MQVTHEQIARRSGVSRAIVTRALHGTPGLRVSEETLNRILETAREMGYQPRGVTTRNIGLVTSLQSLHVDVDLEFIRYLERALRERGYRLLLVNPELPAGQSLGDILNPKTVDGLLFSHWAGGDFTALSSRLPCILLTEEDDAPAEIEQIGVDLRGTCKNVLEYLRERGHERVALLSGSQSSGRFYRRLEVAARQAAQTLGWAQHQLRIANRLPRESHQAVLEMLAGAHPPTAIVTADSERALCAIVGLDGAGVLVPDAISLVSLFDGRPLGESAESVTTTDATGRALAERAVERLLQKIAMPETIPHHVFVPGEIIERTSVRTLQKRRNL